MSLKITFLGTGTSQGVPVIGCECEVCRSTDQRDKRLRCSILISKNGKNLLIDIGPDFRQQMLNYQISELHAILVTHEHNDHIIGLDDVRPFNFQSRRDMPVYCTERVAKEFRNRFAYVFNANPYPGAPKVDIRLIEDLNPLLIEDIEIIPIKVFHGAMPVLGFRVDDFTYITDAKTFPKEAIDKIKGSKVLVINALHHKEHHSHLNVKEATTLIDSLGPEQAYLTHCSHRMGLHEAINKTLPKKVNLAYDGLVLDL